MPSVPLPTAYRDQMIQMLGATEAETFLSSYSAERLYGLRVNTLKVTNDSPMMRALHQIFGLKPVSWCPDGFYYPEDKRPGKHPYHAAGLYYIQEPSAMSAVELLDPKPGETVLDLAAAPGGKSTQIAAKMQGEGLLVSNEIHPARAKILAENIERMGVQNALVTNASPDQLSARFPLAFDRIMLDAPCSGEGMFRKDERAVEEWSPEAVELCAARQRDILHDAVKMLKPGGTMAYSTCTFNRSENEENMRWLLAQYPFMELLEEKRIWPHQQAGEGHYVALLRRADTDPGDQPFSDNSPGNLNSTSFPGKSSKSSRSARVKGTAVKGNEEMQAVQTCLSWLKEQTTGFRVDEDRLVAFGEALYLLPRGKELQLTPDLLKGLKIPRAGLRLGVSRKGRFEPDHALALALSREQAVSSVDFAADSAEIAAYLRGEVLAVEPSLQGWTLVMIDGFPIGFGKCSGGQLKNHYPKGLRQTGK
ncbi:RsmF rRNA methyltransferase first C-terminal domain-containing protein [Paenibacillus physcomitrellae]|uniref:tRNA/rRNA methyltransferase n=1 Tax=Paenibacillus physcomitrellae TaxID=1619311 RepID=A0ABQ1GIF1_9BACL|nr:RsmF rRNA methyltransferase first C-terminal domain-containing protein [Paenibacillus physcomitrellae]GGA44433.1 tRNA/rRNA methyltransferase [Paenibacillus physcomitrellae]